MVRTKLWAIALFLIASASLTAQQYTLDEAVSYALEHSDAIKNRMLDVRSAEYDIQEVKAMGMPQVNGGVDYNYYFYQPKQPLNDFITPAVYGVLKGEMLVPQDREVPVLPPQEVSFVQPQNLTAKIGVTQLLFDGGYLYGLKASKLYKELAKRNVDATEQMIKNDVTKAYLAVLVAEINKQTIADNIKTVTTSLHEVTEMYKQGFTESLDVDRLQLSLDELGIQQQNVEQYMDLSKNLLKFQMGYPIDDPITLSESIDALVAKFDAEMVDTYTIDPSLRSEYKLLETAQSLNELNLKRNKAGYYPSVVGFANFQESLQRSNLFDNDQTGFLPTGVLGFSINVPIYDGGTKKAKIQKVKINMEKVELQKEEFRKGMLLQVRNAEAAYANAKRMLSNRKKALDMTQSIFDRTKIKFREGVGSSIEVTQAESSLYQAQTRYINALYDLLQAKVDLDIALGKI